MLSYGNDETLLFENHATIIYNFQQVSTVICIAPRICSKKKCGNHIRIVCFALHVRPFSSLVNPALFYNLSHAAIVFASILVVKSTRLRICR